MKKKKIKITGIISLLCVIFSIYLIYAIYKFSQIETVLRYSIIGIIVLLDIFIILKLFFNKKKKRYIYNTFLILITICYIFSGFF